MPGKRGGIFMKNKGNANNIFVKECITHALVCLIQTKPLSAVSITELANTAGVSRMAYYRNFNSKEEIFSSYMDIIIDRYDKYTDNLIPGGVYSDKEHMVHYFSWLLENKDFLYAVINSGYGSVFLSKMTKYILGRWCKNKTINMEYYTLVAFSGSLYNLYISWSKNDFKETPEEMAGILYNIHHLKTDG